MEQAVPEFILFSVTIGLFLLKSPCFRHTFLETGDRIGYNKKKIWEDPALFLANP